MIPCPPADHWPDLLAGELPAELGEHLDSCPHCQGALEASWADARRLLAPPALDERAAVERLKRPQDTLDTHDTDETDDAQDVLDRLGPSAHPGALGKWGPYDVLAVRGRGGMGVVLRAFDAELNREVALKVQAPRLAHGAAARKRFRREAVAAAAVRHENVVPIHTVAEFAGLPYLVMEYVDGPSLQERIDQGGPLPVDEVLQIGTKLAAGLAAAHAAGLVHRDVKPANVLLASRERQRPERSQTPVADAPGSPVLTDFGLARAADDPGLTATGVLCGTPAYMAPEQVVGDPVDWRADLYGLGGTLYALAAGRPPHTAASKLELLRQVCDGTPPPLRAVNPNVPVWLEELVMTLLAKEPARRYPSAAAVGELLEGCLAHRRTGAPLPSELRRRPARRYRFATLALALCAVVAAVVIKLQTPDGTLIVEIDDPSVKVSVDGSDLVITGAGVQELRVKPGPHTVQTARDGKPAEDEVVTVTSGGKQVVRVKREPKAADDVSAETMRRVREIARRIEANAKAPPPVENDAGVLMVAVGETKRFQPVARKTIRFMSWQPETVARAQIIADDAAALAVTGLAAGKASVLVTDVEGTVSRLTVVVQAAGAAKPVPDKTDMPAITNPATGKLDSFAPVPLVPRQPRQAREIRLNAAVASLAFAPDGNHLVAGSADAMAYLWDVRTKVWHELADHGRGPVAVAVSPDGKVIVTGGEDGEVRAWELASAKQLWQAAVHQKVAAIAFVPGHKLIACAGGSAPDKGSVQLLVAARGKTAATFEFDSSVVGLAVSPIGGSPAVILANGRIFTVATGTNGGRPAAIAPDEKFQEDRRHFGMAVRAVAFAPDGQTFAVAYGDEDPNLVKRLIVWRPLEKCDPFAAEGGRKWFNHAATVGQIDVPAVVALAYSPDGRLLATGSAAGAVQLWAVQALTDKSVRAKDALVTLQPSGPAVRHVAFSPDGRWLAAGSDDKTVRVWEFDGEPTPQRR